MKKGVTPIIAIVLLILITFVAIGAIAGLVTQLTDIDIGDQFADQAEIQDIDLSYDSVYETTVDVEGGDEEEVIALTVRNSGETDLNLAEDVELHFGPEGEDPMNLNQTENIFGDWHMELEEDYDCFEESEEDIILAPGETETCEFTPVRFPTGVESINLRMEMVDFDEGFSYTCDPASSDDVTC